MDELIRKVAALGLPAVILAVVMASTGLAGAAAITSALAILGGPAGMVGGIFALGTVGILTDLLAKFGIELVLMRIYEIRSEKENVEKLCQEIDNLPFISNELKQKVKTLINKQIIFVLAGRTGVGKSSTVNSLLDCEVAKTGKYEPTTKSVDTYEHKVNGINFIIVDTPGLCDEEEEAGNDQKYLNLMKPKIQKMVSMWFVSQLNDTRVTSDEKRVIKRLSKAFGKKVWECSVIVFTYANSVTASEYEETLKIRTELIRKEIAKYVGEDTANQIPSIAVDNKSETTPDGKKWLGEFFTRVFVRASESGSVVFAAAMKDSAFSSSGKSRIELDENQKEEIKNKIKKGLIGGLASGGTVVGLFLGPGGAIVGGLLGTVVGLWLELDRRNA
ncbi:GTPase [Dolichospermum sp. UHCC 0684]|jgi:small GTP-binding protein|uniref:GTPase n=1 Tax=unclassified Dolichospermum TaxID=2622029 RepID=UPI001445ABE3|nr:MULTISPECIES: GTPase [unclassified Dolichospermum]MEA5530273.1 GTPase [Dolichospermum sp. UHCC 0684]MTJ35258.1 GTPase RsgA [Dolichospermum sp. UHCC 0260]